jgi:predicted kinase
VHVTTGLPASGKTTHARTLGALRFNLDDYRLMMGNEAWDGAKETAAIEAMAQSALAAVNAGHDIVLDNTHLVPRLPKRYKTLFAQHEVKFVVHDFTGVPVDECVRRDAARPNAVGEDAIRGLLDRHRRATKGGWRLTDEWMNDRPTVQPYVPDPLAASAVLCDIDGTLAIHAGRGPYDLAKCETDLLNEEVARILAICDRADDYVILLSGRQSEYREHTERWLAKHQVPYDELWMRAADDRRGDDIVKAELFDEHVRHRFKVRFVLDDRDRVVALWRRMGLKCWQVNYGAF